MDQLLIFIIAKQKHNIVLLNPIKTKAMATVKIKIDKLDVFIG